MLLGLLLKEQQLFFSSFPLKIPLLSWIPGRALNLK